MITYSLGAIYPKLFTIMVSAPLWSRRWYCVTSARFWAGERTG
jgi:hypothetical protein